VYGEDGADYPDNAFRFAFFTRAVLAVTEALGLAPDVFHIHDWPSALLPIYHPGERTVLTVHNLAYQGLFPSAWLTRLGLPPELFRIDGLEFYGQLSFLKGGLVTADQITTVSPTYAREIQTEAFGAGLEGVVRARAERLTGIVNGIDPRDWHPGKDAALVAPYSSTRLAGKARGKRALQQELDLSVSPHTPVLAAIGRLDPQKGFDVLLEAAPALVAGGRAQLVVLGSGNDGILEAFRRLATRFPGAVSVNRGFQDALGRRIYAGADIFLMPSRYEPCGLGQLIALRYGTLPVVRATGGLADTIRDLDADPETGNGFSFVEYSAAALTAAVSRAIRYYGDEKRWTRWVRRAMRQDFSWNRSAADYARVYERAIGRS
jgi:starch synthase